MQSGSLFYYYNSIVTGHSKHHCDRTIKKSWWQLFRENFSFAFEIVIHLAIPYPFYERYVHREFFDLRIFDKPIIINYFLSDYLMLFMYLRIFICLRTCFNFSVFSDAYTKKLCRSNGFENSFRFTIRCLFSVYPATMFWTMFISITFSLAHLVRIFEYPLLLTIYHTLQIEKEASVSEVDQLDRFSNALYMTVMTITTVGYGDFVPHSAEGKCVMMVAALTGAVMISLFVLVTTAIFQLNKDETNVFRKVNLAQSAAKTI